MLAVALVVSIAQPAEAEKKLPDEPLAAPTSTKVKRKELQRRLRSSTVSVLRHIPGLGLLAQGGNAPQYLLRGFDASQSATLGVSVDGVPVNITSHAYSHGYADPSFVIADTLDSVALHEGLYAARFTSFALAGQLELKTIDRVDRAVVRLAQELALDTQYKVRRTYRLTGMFSPAIEDGSALLATEVSLDDGHFVHPQRLRRFAVLGKWKRWVGPGVMSAMMQLYSGRWFDAGLLAQSQIANDRLTPLSAADPTQGGIALRTSLRLSYEVKDDEETWHLSSYLVDSDVRLYSNPTLFLRDTMFGDQLEYADARAYYGFDGYYERPHRFSRLDLRGRLRLGVQARVDHAENLTWHSPRRLRRTDCFGTINPCTDLAPQTRSAGFYVEEVLRIAPLLLVGGFRLDQEVWNVDDRDSDTMLGPTSLGAIGAQARMSPKLGMILELGAAELWFLAGTGAQNTDARAARSGYGAFVRAYAAETGVRVRPDEHTSGAIAAWVSTIDKHQVWRPTDAEIATVPEASRFGLDARFAAQPTSWLALDASLSIARGRSVNVAPKVLPGAPRFIAHAGVTAFRDKSFGSARVRSIGARATTDELLPANDYTLVDIIAGHRWRVLDVSLSVENLLDTGWRELQIASDVRTSRRVDVIRDLLATTGTPRTIMLTLGYAR